MSVVYRRVRLFSIQYVLRKRACLSKANAEIISASGLSWSSSQASYPPDCPGERPFIPEGFKTDNTLPEWEAQGAAWKECCDGYRCEAWWGSLEGSPDGEPVVLDAPLDWPDCCALCSNSNGGGGNVTDDNQSTASAACMGWSFDPSTGSCQRMSAVGSVSRDSSWGVSSTVHGYPGYFEAPLNDCWERDEYDLCTNTNLAFIIPGVALAFFGLLSCFFWVIRPLSNSPGLLRELIADPESRLVKAACVQVIRRRRKRLERHTIFRTRTHCFKHPCIP